MSSWKDKEALERLYHKENLSTREIGERLGCNQGTVVYWMDKFGIERRNQADAFKSAIRRNPAHFETYMHGYERWSNQFKGETDYVRVHRLLAVAKYGFDEVCGKDVHHKNHIPWDNRAENIELMDHIEHSKHHTPKGMNPRTRWKNAD